MIDPPPWLAVLGGFDRERWWCQVVCTHGTGSVAGSKLLTVGFDHASGNGTHFAAPPDVHLGRIAVENDEHDLPATWPGQPPTLVGRPTSQRGSINATCPDKTCQRNFRLPRDAWGHLLDTARVNDIRWIDLSLVV